MSEYVYYYGRIDYPGLVMRQLDRIASVRTNMSEPPLAPDVAAYYNAVVTLYMIIPKNVRDKIGKPPRSLGELDGYVIRMRDELERIGLVGGKPLEVGRSAGVLEEGY